MLLEDDDLTAEFILERLVSEFGDETKVRLLRTENEFCEVFDELCSAPPDAFIFDVRVRWTSPRPDLPPQPPDKSDSTIAGWRCYKAVKEKNPKSLCILFTVLEHADLKARFADEVVGVAHVAKSQGLDVLAQRLHAMLGKQ